jgi:ATP-dependent protease HslVU (ClpYQ) peptidase subunit
MTTVAYRSGVLAADTQSAGEDGTKYRMRKIHMTTHSGVLYGCAGDTSAILRIRRWMERNTTSRPRLPKDTDADVLMVKPDGTLWMLNDAFDWEPVDAKFHAIGSGASFALGAMARGATAVQAVKIAARFDINTSAPIDTLVLPRASA